MFCDAVRYVTYMFWKIYVLELLHCVQLRFVTLCHVTFTLCSKIFFFLFVLSGKLLIKSCHFLKKNYSSEHGTDKICSRSRKCSEFSSEPFRVGQKSTESRFAPFTEEKIARNTALNPSWKSNINWEANQISNATATGTPTRVWTLATAETTSTDAFFGLRIVKVAFWAAAVAGVHTANIPAVASVPTYCMLLVPDATVCLPFVASFSC